MVPSGFTLLFSKSRRGAGRFAPGEVEVDADLKRTVLEKKKKKTGRLSGFTSKGFVLGFRLTKDDIAVAAMGLAKRDKTR